MKGINFQFTKKSSPFQRYEVTPGHLGRYIQTRNKKGRHLQLNSVLRILRFLYVRLNLVTLALLNYLKKNLL